ncbi:MAG: DUF3575 domain-containing protein [Bacteroidales bacterium]|nr:DUF3575 domain-containing protein [Bacteroidales bacterium]
MRTRFLIWLLNLTVVFSIAGSVPLYSQDFSIRTNLLWDAVSEPNLGVEFPVGDHWSVGGDFGLKAWPRWLAWDWDNANPTHWRNFAVVPEVRYYLNEVYQGFFAGADALYTHYNVGAVPTPFHMYPEVENYRLQGSYWAGGLFAGYAWWPWQHWRLEVEAGAAVGLAAYDRYDCPHCGTKLAEERKVRVVPKLALNVAYNPVSKEKHQARKASAMVVSGRDTITVLTPPVAFVVQLREITAPETAPDRLARQNDWVIPIEKYRPLDYLTRPGRDSVMYVTYPVDDARLDPSFGNNAATLDKLQEAIEVIRDAETTDELLISIVGLASIEGPQERNDTLSVRRARAVANYLQENTFIGHRHFEIIGKGEAWDWFRAQLEAAPSGNGKLLDILNTEADPDKRERLIKADAGLYRQVREKFLADQRNSGYIRVYYGNKPDSVTARWNGAVTDLLKAKRYREAVQMMEADPVLLSRVEADPEAANAYGIALYFTALDNHDTQAEARAIELLKKAARDGSVAARENLKGIDTYGPARKEYEAWKEIINENER